MQIVRRRSKIEQNRTVVNLRRGPIRPFPPSSRVSPRPSSCLADLGGITSACTVHCTAVIPLLPNSSSPTRSRPSPANAGTLGKGRSLLPVGACRRSDEDGAPAYPDDIFLSLQRCSVG